MTSFKIYTENKAGAVAVISEVVTPYYDGFNIMSGFGVWKGTPENALVVEIIADDIDRATIGEIAVEIRRRLNQDAVLVSETYLSGLTMFDADGAGDLTEGERTLSDPDNDCCCENCVDCKCREKGTDKGPEYVSVANIAGVNFEVWMDGVGRLMSFPKGEIGGVAYNPYNGKFITLKRESEQ